MPLNLFAGIPVSNCAAAVGWYTGLFGAPPSFRPCENEAVWELADHRFVYIDQRPAHAGHAMLTAFVDDLDSRLAQLAARGLAPAEIQTYPQGARKAIFRDPDGNEIGLAGGPP